MAELVPLYRTIIQLDAHHYDAYIGLGEVRDCWALEYSDGRSFVFYCILYFESAPTLFFLFF